MTPEIQIRIAMLREKSRAGTITTEEYREAILLMRQGRVSAAAISEKSRTAKAKKVVNSDDLLGELDGL